MVKSFLFLILLGSVWAACAQQNPSTALSNVRVIEAPFRMPGLERERKIRIYLPPNYESDTTSYPVLYMHDGQNLFDDATSFVGEWGVDEVLNDLASTKSLELIVVGIDNGGEHRIHELTAWDHPKYGKSQGKAYMDFIVNVVKPYIDGHYRTKPDRKNTAVMGSSLGGLISHYAIYHYSGVFGKAGIFSPSYWYSELVFSETEAMPLPRDTRLYLLMGQKEGQSMVLPYERMIELIKTSGHPAGNLKTKLNPEGEHNEKFWKTEFGEAVLWLFK